MPKKSGRNVRESRIGKRINDSGTDDNFSISKKFRGIRVNVKIAKRWFFVKKRLEFTTDDELATYLLDLAEPIVRRDGRCAASGDWKTDKDKENDSEVVKIDDKESFPNEEPLRRSPRKQLVVASDAAEAAQEISKTLCSQPPEVDATPIPELPEKRKSRVKHHKTKGKHHRDKRGRRKHSKNSENKNLIREIDDEVAVTSRINAKTEESEKIVKRRSDSIVSNSKLPVDRSSIADHDYEPEKPEIIPEKQKFRIPEIAKNPENVENSSTMGVEKNIVDKNDDSVSNDWSLKLEETSEFPTTLKDDEIVDDNPEKRSHPRDSNEKSIVPRELDDLEPEIHSSEARTQPEIDEKKPKKKRKHGKQDSSMDNEISEDRETDGGNHKRHRKKHKYPTLHKKRKYHDVRRAPQDGRAAGLEDLESPELDIILPEPTSTSSNVDLRVSDVSTTIGEPHRLAIKIKLCSDCNDRHVEDACPLGSTEYAIPDAVTHGEWLKAHKNNSEIAKAMNSEDPMSEGYAILNDEPEDSDDDSANGEQYKTRTKAEVEEKMLRVNDDRPLYSRDSLPNCFELRVVNAEHGIGIYAKQCLPMYAKLGPLVGNPVKEMDIPDDFTMRHIWEIDENGKTSYISTTNPLRSNWIRYMRPADSKDERTVAVVTNNGELHLVTTRNITTGMELTYWADSQSSTWTRKNKTDKTNCGGCNLNFTHPIYYRLHCCIFHDTNYSLTIRKYHCKICGDAVLGKDNIMKHAADLHGGRGAYQCQYCRKFFLRLNYLEMHRTYGCSQNPQRSRPLCDFCGRKFCQPQKLKVHIKRMHSDMSEVLREFQCKLCLKLLGSRAALQRHMKEVHHKDVVAAATCDRCGKMFQNKSNLKIHMLTHSGVKPFKCKEKDCKAAFTTKQCLQFHYKKVHGLTEEMMPKIERSVAYTFDAYSGGLVETAARGRASRSGRRGSQENSNSAMSIDDCSSEHSSRADASVSSFQATINEFDNDAVATSTSNADPEIQDYPIQQRELPENDIQDFEPHNRDLPDREIKKRDSHDREMENCDYQNNDVRNNDLHDREMQNRDFNDRESQNCDFNDREMQNRDFNDSEMHNRDLENSELQNRDLRDEDLDGNDLRNREIAASPIPSSHREIQMSSSSVSPLENLRQPSDVDFYGISRLPSKGSKKWMGEFNPPADVEIVDQNSATLSREVYEFDDGGKKSNDRNDGSTSGLLNGEKLGLNIYRRPESTNASLLVEAALDAAERDIGAVSSPMIDENDRDGNLYAITNQLQSPLPPRSSETHLDSYIHQQDDMMSPSGASEDRKTPTIHGQMDYHLHRPIDYINSPRTHTIEHYLPPDELPRVSSPGNYIHMSHDDLTSPSATPNSNRYPGIHHHNHHHNHHHQVPADNASSDEGDSVAQNLSLPVKGKSLQLDLSTSYKYDGIDTDFCRERTNFEPIVLNPGELQGLDMSARGYHHGLGQQLPNRNYHHHLYEITERQTVDLSRTSGYSISPPPAPYSHNEVLRIVSLDLTPSHSVDLSLSRSHHLHGNGNRPVGNERGQIVGGNSHNAESSNSHVVPDALDERLSSPPPNSSITGYNASYPVSPAPYHPPRPAYHHYSGYY